ncbi:MAG: NAD(P)H-dependent glycerol-3-phosphate dehydrogenase [Maricaulaceae bacterium]
MTDSFKHMGVIGGGAWGTALAQTLASSGCNVTLWAFEEDCVNAINAQHENTLYLPEVALHKSIRATGNMADLAACGAVLAVAPAQHMRRTLESYAPHAPNGQPIILCSKGIEISTRSFMTDVLADVIPQAQAGVLSGPSFAIDVAKGLPTAVTLACKDEALGQKLIKSIAAPTFRPYLSDDILGAEIGGAVKNVLAIVCGIVLGKELGRSAHAAIIARGFAEMRRLGTALGCKPETLTGLCGLGDLVLTCSSEQSRNMSCGLAMGRGQSAEEILKNRQSVTEGVATAPALKQLAQELKVDMPICFAMADILSGELTVDAAITALLSREHTSEV